MCHMGDNEERQLLRDIIPDQEPGKIDAAQRMLASPGDATSAAMSPTARCRSKSRPLAFSAAAPCSGW
jgi:hypothetical protein